MRRGSYCMRWQRHKGARERALRVGASRESIIAPPFAPVCTAPRNAGPLVPPLAIAYAAPAGALA